MKTEPMMNADFSGSWKLLHSEMHHFTTFLLMPLHVQLNRPATIHLSTIQYVSRYSCHDTIHDTIPYITTKREGYCLVCCSWAQKSVQLTSLVGSTHAFLVSAILNVTLNTEHGFLSVFLTVGPQGFGNLPRPPPPPVPMEAWGPQTLRKAH